MGKRKCDGKNILKIMSLLKQMMLARSKQIQQSFSFKGF